MGFERGGALIARVFDAACWVGHAFPENIFALRKRLRRS
jgi:hypothetical protein